MKEAEFPVPPSDLPFAHGCSSDQWEELLLREIIHKEDGRYLIYYSFGENV
ncbi:MAG: hypothetical protein HY692_02655 [Cyanobacteria bacterium NC_groundwater_1444_Ag_S-0.65um_54_12]|nr:hypothetical protein [Cyanobacteria bacterium NC_groundwater_1444_Ag_S-0.65um_54_12]